MSANDTAFYCSDHSMAVGEALFGTAPHIQTALILEYNGRWESSVLDSEGLPEAVRAFLKSFERTLPDVKIWFIRRNKEAPASESIMFYVACVREKNPALYAYRLASYEDLLALDIPAIVAESPAAAAYRQDDPLVLACTHGRRDRCCARHGRPVFEQLAHLMPDEVWQSSHLGGHRLAANVVVLPQGLYYGRVASLGGDLQFVADALRRRQVVLEAYRGRACYTKPVQAADYFARHETGLTGWNALHLVDSERLADGRWRVIFAQNADDAQIVITLRAVVSEFRSYMNCDDAEPEVVTQYVLDACELPAAG